MCFHVFSRVFWRGRHGLWLSLGFLKTTTKSQTHSSFHASIGIAYRMCHMTHICLFVYPFVCLCVRTVAECSCVSPVFLSVWLSFCLSIFFPIHVSVVFPRFSPRYKSIRLSCINCLRRVYVHSNDTRDCCRCRDLLYCAVHHSARHRWHCSHSRRVRSSHTRK